jgi:peptide/nickel transport system substrate-binding protein
MRSKLLIPFVFVLIASMMLASCAPAATSTPEVIQQTVIVAGTPQTVVVTATPAATQAAAAPAPAKSKDPTTWVTLEFGSPQTFDTASDYESSGLEFIQNTYDFLFFYNKQNDTTLVPMLATEIPTVANGDISADGKTYTFKLRPGVKFHNGDPMTAHDVAYSLQRFILQGSASSPAWILTQPVLGLANTDISQLIDPSGKLIDDPANLQKADPTKLMDACTQVTNAITADDTAMTVTMKLAQAYAPLTISLSEFGAVTDQKWVAANGGWDGNCNDWAKFYFPGYDAINKLGIGTSENGTGPFILDHVTPGQEIDLKANPNYWVQTPLWDGGPTGAPKLQKVIIKDVGDFATRLATFQAGDADNIAPGSAADYAQLDPLSGISCDHSTGKCAPSSTPDQPFVRWYNVAVATHAQVMYTFDINTAGGNPYIGSGKLDGNGIPPNFFDDTNIRKAFSECFDFNAYINQVFKPQGINATQVGSMFLPGEPGYDANAPKYSYNPDQCKADFQASTLKSADGKGVWDTGFRFTMGYNAGNTSRQTVALIFQQDLAQLNPKFKIDIEAVQWSSFLADAAANKDPIFIVGWLEDFPDPQDWVVPFAATGGTYVAWQHIPKSISSQFDTLIQQGVSETDPAKRDAIYKQFNQVYYDQATVLPLVIAPTNYYVQKWDNGFYVNPLYGWLYYYPFSKN